VNKVPLQCETEILNEKESNKNQQSDFVELGFSTFSFVQEDFLKYSCQKRVFNRNRSLKMS
jgi:hypothetical protein